MDLLPTLDIYNANQIKQEKNKTEQLETTEKKE